MAAETVSNIGFNLADPETGLGLPAFLDRRVFAVPHTYVGRWTAQPLGPNAFGAFQGEDGPTFIYVGADVDDARLERGLSKFSSLYGVTSQQLKAARNGETVCVRLTAKDLASQDGVTA